MLNLRILIEKLIYVIDLCHNFAAEKEMKRVLRIK